MKAEIITARATEWDTKSLQSGVSISWKGLLSDQPETQKMQFTHREKQQILKNLKLESCLAFMVKEVIH